MGTDWSSREEGGEAGMRGNSGEGSYTFQLSNNLLLKLMFFSINLLDNKINKEHYEVK